MPAPEEREEEPQHETCDRRRREPHEGASQNRGGSTKGGSCGGYAPRSSRSAETVSTA